MYWYTEHIFKYTWLDFKQNWIYAKGASLHVWLLHILSLKS